MTVRERLESIETMSTTTDAIEVIDHLQTDGISRETAKELIDYVDKQRGDLVTDQSLQAALRQEVEPLKRDVNWLKWIVGIGLTAIPVILLTVMIYLHSSINERLDRIEQRVEGRFEKMEADIKEIKELLQKR